MAASEFQRTIMSNLNRQGMSLANLAECTGYSAILLENLIAGKTRQIPVDFFVRVADALDLTMGERRLGTLVGIRDREAKLALD
jgi:lambda repressor-like predicted transcriptional regulator